MVVVVVVAVVVVAGTALWIGEVDGEGDGHFETQSSY